jgi:plastocyanin
MKKAYLPTLFVAISCFLFINYLSVAAAGPVPDSAGSSSVAGAVKFTGVAPKPARIDMSFDPNCAKAHTTPATTQDIVVGGGGALENVIVYVSDGLAGQTFAPPTEPVVLEQKGCVYQPRVIALQANQKLDVKNDDATSHNIHPMPVNNREWNKTQPPGVPIEESFAREEIAIPVKCNIHPWMRGYVAVFKHPFFAVTDKNGNFDLKNLPPGSYTITAWHEKLGTRSQKITVSAGQPGKVDFTFKQ